MVAGNSLPMPPDWRHTMPMQLMKSFTVLGASDIARPSGLGGHTYSRVSIITR